jgi:hypothetical protein
METSDSSRRPVGPLLLWVSRACIVLGILLSLTGPCRYWGDQDRDLERTASLLQGEWSVVSKGPDAPVFGKTPSGILYLVLAPAMALSGRPEWLYTYMDVLILLGCIPMWFLGRYLGGRKLGWLAAALYAMSSDVMEVVCGFDSYLDPSHYSERKIWRRTIHHGH